MVIGWLLLGWLHAVAGAQEAVEVDEGTPAAEAVDDPASIEVIVYEELLVEKARQALYPARCGPSAMRVRHSPFLGV